MAKTGGKFVFYAGTGPENTAEILRLFDKEIEKLATTLPTDEELSRAKLQMKSALLVDSQKNADVGDYLATHRLTNTDAHAELLAKVDQISAEDIQRVAKKYLTRPSKTVVMAPEKALKDQGLLTKTP